MIGIKYWLKRKVITCSLLESSARMRYYFKKKVKQTFATGNSYTHIHSVLYKITHGSKF